MTRALTVVAMLAACNDGGPSGSVQPGSAIEGATASKPLGRLNKAEYNNTIQEIFQTDARPADDWPADATTYGFDNVSEGLSVTPLHVELHEGALDELLHDLFVYKDEELASYRIQAEGAGNTYVGGEPTAGGYRFSEDGSVTTTLNLVDDGLYEIGLRAWGAGATPPAVEVTINGEVIAGVEITGTLDHPQLWATDLVLDNGLHTITVSFLAPEEDANTFTLDWLSLDGPLDPEHGRSSVYAQRVPCDPTIIGDDACAREVLASFGLLAWRRPLDAADVDFFLELYIAGRDIDLSWHDAIQVALKGVLLSPEFFYRFEQDPTEGPARTLDGYELASRLSYFLWSSAPDDTLLRVAENGSLTEPAVLDAQVRRMLADDRARALVDNFAEQWLGVRTIAHISPSAEVYPSFDEDLRAAMQEEIRLMAADHLLQDRSVLDMLVTQETWMNARLAEHYGQPWSGAEGQWSLVSVEGQPRMGLLTTPGWLAARADVDRSSVVQRGKWIMDNLLCDEIPPPPPDVDGSADPDLSVVMSVREQIESTRTYNEACTGCHSWMDPLGFSLEHYDGVGSFRSVDVIGFPIDASGTLPDGTSFRTAMQLGGILAADPRVADCAAEKLFTYALGRPPAVEEESYVADLSDAFASSGYRFDALVAAMVRNPAFLTKSAPTEVE